jgi:phosphoglycolate phosphatase-like HAD superfamily hydrolase
MARARAHHGVTEFQRVVSVGDGMWDLTTAEDLGLEFIAIAGGAKRGELERAGATRFHEDYTGPFHLEFEADPAPSV